MKRDWDMIREILVRLEEKGPDDHGLTLRDFDPDKAYEYAYHVELLFEADLISGLRSEEIGSDVPDFIVFRLTWNGHEFLDAIRSDTIWNKTKSSFVQGGLSMTIDLIKSVATDIAATYLKSSIGI